jgi:hypothetical protein
MILENYCRIVYLYPLYEMHQGLERTLATSEPTNGVTAQGRREGNDEAEGS